MINVLLSQSEKNKIAQPETQSLYPIYHSSTYPVSMIHYPLSINDNYHPSVSGTVHRRQSPQSVAVTTISGSYSLLYVKGLNQVRIPRLLRRIGREETADAHVDLVSTDLEASSAIQINCRLLVPAAKVFEYVNVKVSQLRHVVGEKAEDACTRAASVEVSDRSEPDDFARLIGVTIKEATTCRMGQLKARVHNTNLEGDASEGA
jgi:hypothetical protein